MYKPVMASASPGLVTSAPPVTFAFGQSDLVMCTPPFVSANKGSNTAPTPTESVPGRIIGILVGTEWNATKSNHEYRRWTVVQLASTGARGWQACLMPLAQVGAWPEARAQESTTTVLLPPLSAGECDAMLRDAALAKKPGSYNSHLCAARKQRKGQLEEVESGLQHERTRSAARMVASPAPARLTERASSPQSGIKHGLDGIGEKKIDEYSEDQLLLALQEHGLPAPASTEQNKSLYAKRLLFQK